VKKRGGGRGLSWEKKGRREEGEKEGRCIRNAQSFHNLNLTADFRRAAVGEEGGKKRKRGGKKKAAQYLHRIFFHECDNLSFRLEFVASRGGLKKTRPSGKEKGRKEIHGKEKKKKRERGEGGRGGGEKWSSRGQSLRNCNQFASLFRSTIRARKGKGRKKAAARRKKKKKEGR